MAVSGRRREARNAGLDRLLDRPMALLPDCQLVVVPHQLLAEGHNLSDNGRDLFGTKCIPLWRERDAGLIEQLVESITSLLEGVEVY